MLCKLIQKGPAPLWFPPADSLLPLSGMLPSTPCNKLTLFLTIKKKDKNKSKVKTKKLPKGAENVSVERICPAWFWVQSPVLQKDSKSKSCNYKLTMVGMLVLVFRKAGARSSWSTRQVPVQPGLYEETLPHKNQKQRGKQNKQQAK